MNKFYSIDVDDKSDLIIAENYLKYLKKVIKMITRPLKGIIPVVITTLNKDQSIDKNAQERLIKFLQKKVGGYWCLGTVAKI